MPYPSDVVEIPDPGQPWTSEDVLHTGSQPPIVISSSGDQWRADGSAGLHLLPGVEGLADPPRVIQSDDPAQWDGSLYRGVRYSAREVFLPMYLEADHAHLLRPAMRRLAALLDPRRGPVTVTVQHPDADVRSISGRVSTPMATTSESAEGAWWHRVGMTLWCPDPFWVSPPVSLTFRALPPSPFLGPAFLPMRLSSSQVLGDVTVDNPGDADAYPVWTVTGPVGALTVTSGAQAWSLPAGVAAGETVTVDTRRGQQRVADADGPAWGRLSASSRLWPLPPGRSQVSITATGTSTATAVDVTWEPRWLTAW